MRRIVIALAILGLAAAAPLLARGDDKEIARQIIAKLKEEKAAGRLQGFEIDLKVEDGVVYVRGKVASREQETMVLETARLTPGVTQVLRNIQVGDPATVANNSSRRPQPAAAPEIAPPTPPPAPAPQAMQPARIARQEPEPQRSSRRNPADEATIQMLTGPATPRAINLAEQSQPRVLHASPAQPAAQVAPPQSVVQASPPEVIIRTPPPAPRMPTAEPSPMRIVQQPSQPAPQAAQRPMQLVHEPASQSSRRSAVQIMAEPAPQAVASPAPQVAARPQYPVTRPVETPVASPIAQVNNITPASANGSTPVVQSAAAVHHEAIPAPAKPAPSANVNDKDTAIARQIITRLKQEREAGNLEGMDLDLKVENSVVWFRGTVVSAEQEKIVLNTARITPGVAKVLKDITVRKSAEAVASTSTSQAIAPDATQTVQAAAVQPAQETAARPAAPQAAAPAANTAATGLQSVGPAQPQLAPVHPYYAYPYAGYYPAYNQSPVAFAPAQPASAQIADAAGAATGAAPGMAPYCPTPMHAAGGFGGAGGVRYDHPQLPGYAWPTYAAHPNYGAVTYPKQYSPTVWPYIGPFYPYPQVPLGWRKVTLEWDDGWWQLDFKDQSRPWKMR